MKQKPAPINFTSDSKSAKILEISKDDKENKTSLKVIKGEMSVIITLLLVYVFLVLLFTVMFIFFPISTARWFGYVPEDRHSKVLGLNTNSLNLAGSIPKTILQPVGRMSLNLVKNIDPEAYSQVASLTILDPNEVLSLGSDGKVLPVKSIKISDSSLLDITTSEIIQNLNAEFLWERKPGTEAGDIAIVGEEGTIEGLIISKLDNSNLSGNAEISNDNLANSLITITSEGIITGGATISLGGRLTLSASERDTLSSVTERGSSTSNTVSFSSFSANGNISLNDSEWSITDSGVASGITGITADSISFANIESDTNINSLLVGSGGSLTTSGSGVITATDLACTNCIGATEINDLVLETDTAGNFVASITNGEGILGGDAGSEGSTLTLSIDESASLTWTGDETFTTLSTTGTTILGNNSSTITINSSSWDINSSGVVSGLSINNSSLVNSSITVDTSTGLSGGGVVSLGEALTLTNSGVTTLTGTSNQVNVSAATGAITLSLPQNVNSGASPTFSGLNLTSTSNQLIFSTTNTGTLNWSPSATRTLTLPDTTDTLLARNTTDTLTNKTLTSPVINGTITTSGLTLPAFTASGNISGSSSPTITNFGSINGLTLTSSSIQPSASGSISIQSNGANTVTIDAGGAATLSLGATNSNALVIGRSGVTTSINGVGDINNLKIGSGTTILKHLSGTATFDGSGITLGACEDLGTVTVTGASVGDTVTTTPTATSGGIETLLLMWNAYVSSADTITIRACNVATLGTQNPGNQTWRADVWQH